MFTLCPAPDIRVGADRIQELSLILRQWSAKAVMVVTTHDLVQLGLVDSLKTILHEAGCRYVLFDGVEPDPTLQLVEAATAQAKEEKIDTVIGFGGGSALDTAKMVAALVTHPKSVDAYLGTDLLDHPVLPLIAIPTTAGTGSEVTPIAILSDTRDDLKKGVISNKLIPRLTILDPIFTVGLPPHITAMTGMDALTHAIEAYTAKRANPYSDALALQAIELISRNLREAYANGKNLIARENMLVGSLLAGLAFANAGVGAVHAFAYPLGGMFHIPHGLANSLMLPTILRYNVVGNETRFVTLGEHFLPESAGRVLPEQIIEAVEALCKDLNIPSNLEKAKVPRQSIPKMAEGVMTITRLLENNPRAIGYDDAVQLYTDAYEQAIW